MNEKEILHRFYNIYWRSPTLAEFQACGGKLTYINQKYGSYTNMLKKLKYPENLRNSITVEATSPTGNVFTGTSEEVAEEIGCIPQSVMRGLRLNSGKVKKYTLRKIPFDVKTFNEYKEGGSNADK